MKEWKFNLFTIYNQPERKGFQFFEVLEPVNDEWEDFQSLLGVTWGTDYLLFTLFNIHLEINI